MARKKDIKAETERPRFTNTPAPSKPEILKDPTPRTAIEKYLRPSGMRINKGWDAGALSRLMQDICGRPVTENEIINEMSAAGFHTETDDGRTYFDANTTHIVQMAADLNNKKNNEEES